MLIILWLLSTCFIHLSIGIPLRNEDGSNINFNKREVVYDGDIKLTKNSVTSLEGASRTKRSVELNALKWPNNTINYHYHHTMDNTSIEYMEAAIEYIRKRTCINFINTTIAESQMRILDDGQCSSAVGFQKLGVQDLRFGSECLNRGAAVHELMHALGLIHEQSRYDRDEYLHINESVVSKELRPNVAMRNRSDIYNLTPFDYGSVMLYFPDAVGNGSIQPKNDDYKYTMGNMGVSFYDMVKINKHYECEKKCDTQLKCENGGYTNPANCSICICPNGYQGILCDQLPTASATHEATTTWVSNLIRFETKSNTTLINPGYAYIVITAPARKTIEIQLTDLIDFECYEGCNTNGVEVKFNGDPRITNPIFCCDNEINSTRIFKSKHNPTIISLYSTFGSSIVGYKARYTDEDYTLGSKTTNGYDEFEYYE